MKKLIFTVLLTLFAGALTSALTAAGDLESTTTLIPNDCPSYKEQVARMEQGNVDLLWVGDSITELWKDAGKDVWNRYYVERPAAAKMPRNAMNFGICGEQTGHVLWRLENAPMEKISPKMAVVMIGTNNLGYGWKPEETVTGIQAVVEKLRALYPNMKILLLEIFPRGHKADDGFRTLIEKTNAGLRAIYADGQVPNVTLYSIGDLFLEEDGTLSPNIMPDFLHPNADGYEIWASAVEPFIIEGLGEKPEILTPAPKEVHHDLFPKHCQALKERKDYSILMFGDSEISYWTLNSDPHHTYVWDKYYGSKGAVNLGVGGDTIPGLLWRYEHYPLDGIDPKLIIFEIGVNDITSIEAAKEDVAYGVRYMVKMMHQRWPKARVIAMACLPFQFKGNSKHGWRTFQAWVDDYNKIFPLYFRDLPYVTTVNICDLYLYPNGEANPDALFDDVHPSTLGFALWGERLNPLVEKLLREAEEEK